LALTSIARKRVPRSSAPTRKTIARVASLALATSGTFVYDGATERLDPAVGVQAWSTGVASPWIGDTTDIYPVIVSAIARAVAPPTAATVVVEPRIWIRSQKLEIQCTNSSQTGCNLVLYPWICRYDNLRPDHLYDLSTNPIETHAGSTTVTGFTSTIGWTPFQSRLHTENVKLLKPIRVHLEGGESYRFVMHNRKPLFLNYGRLFGSYPPGNDSFSFRGVTRGVFFTGTGIPVNDSMDANQIDLSSFSIDLLCRKTFEWSASAQPYHFQDTVKNPADIAAFKIIQPQTGVVNAAPTQV